MGCYVSFGRDVGRGRGGGSAVKVLKFFHGLDWTKLERKEIEPPETLELDGDHDLRHFYDEYVLCVCVCVCVCVCFGEGDGSVVVAS